MKAVRLGGALLVTFLVNASVFPPAHAQSDAVCSKALTPNRASGMYSDDEEALIQHYYESNDGVKLDFPEQGSIDRTSGSRTSNSSEYRQKEAYSWATEILTEANFKAFIDCLQAELAGLHIYVTKVTGGFITLTGQYFITRDPETTALKRWMVVRMIGNNAPVQSIEVGQGMNLHHFQFQWNADRELSFQISIMDKPPNDPSARIIDMEPLLETVLPKPLVVPEFVRVHINATDRRFYSSVDPNKSEKRCVPLSQGARYNLSDFRMMHDNPNPDFGQLVVRSSAYTELDGGSLRVCAEAYCEPSRPGAGCSMGMWLDGYQYVRVANEWAVIR